MSVESQLYEIKLKTDQFKTALDNIEGRMNGFESKVTGVGTTIKGVFGGTLLADAFKNVIGLMKDTVTESINVAREFQNMKDAISFASGDQATTNLKFLDNTIKELGLDAQSTYKGFKTFQGALMGTELEGEKGRDIFLAVSKAASVMKLSAEQTEGTFLALGQMVSKGTVQAEELRGQLGERLPGAFQIFARALGTSTQGLGKMLQKGEVLANDALPKFAIELEKIFSPGVKAAQNSFNANWNRFQNLILETKLFIGNSLIPILNNAFETIKNLNFDGLINAFKDMWASVKPLFDLFGELFGFVGQFITLDDVIKNIALSLRVASFPVRFLIEGFRELGTIAKGAGEMIISSFKAIGQAKNFDFKGALDTLKAGGLNFAKSFGDAGQMQKAFMQNEAQKIHDIFNPKKSTSAFDSVSGAFEASKIGGLSKTSSGASSSGIGVEKVASSTRNININIDNLVKEINFNKAQNFRESESELVDRVRRALLTMVNDVNIVAQ